MSYAEQRVILDADSHLMETPEFLDGYAEPDVVERFRTSPFVRGSRSFIDDGRRRAEARRADPDAAEAGDARVMADKGWLAMGGFDPNERSHVLDLLGFRGQLVFATAASAFLFAGSDAELLYDASRAQNLA